jgi:hypothetical protein
MSTVGVTAAVVGDGWDCTVTVRNGGETRHRVYVSRADLARVMIGDALDRPTLRMSRDSSRIVERGRETAPDRLQVMGLLGPYR